MKVIYQNVSQVIKALAWQKKTKTATDCRSLVLDSCVNVQSKTKFVGKIKILTNTSGESSCNCFLGVGANDNIDAFHTYLINNTPLNLTVGAVTELQGDISITESYVSNDYDVKVSIIGANTSINYQLMTRVTYEVEYYFT